MPYVKESQRKFLDEAVDTNVNLISHGNLLSDEEFLAIAGELNYVFSRTLGKLMGQASYSKLAVITGVLENVKQEFYRRVGEPYEDKKIRENGDIREYIQNG
jgi:hypothetical protein